MQKFIEKLITNRGDKVEDEDFLWRWKQEVYQTYANPNSISTTLQTFARDKGVPLLKTIYNSIIPHSSTIRNILQLPNNEEKKNQSGGCINEMQVNVPLLYKYRIEYFNNFINYLNDKNINISQLTQQIIRYLYINKYSIDYIKMLDYILFLIKDTEFPDETRRTIQQLFNRIAYEISKELSYEISKELSY